MYLYLYKISKNKLEVKLANGFVMSEKIKTASQFTENVKMR